MKYDMKLYKISSAFVLGLAMLTSCDSKLDVQNPNQPTAEIFGHNVSDLEEAVIACYNHIRMEGTYGRVGYMLDVCRGDEVWNSSQVWYMPYDDFNAPFTVDIGSWPWRDWFYTIRACNFVTSELAKVNGTLTEAQQYIKGQALFLRGLSYYMLAGYYQNPMIITDYSVYSSLETMYVPNSTYDEVWDQAESDFKEAMTLLPSRDKGGQWAQGRATSGAAAGYYARSLMMRHKYDEALKVLKDIIAGEYGTYKLMANYGDNFREGSQYENNAESLFEIQLLDYGSQGTVDEWTPVNTSKQATQGSAIESNFAPGDCGGWADLSASPWLYNLFKAERTTKGSLDPRLYWTIGTYEPEWDGFEYGNKIYTLKQTDDWANKNNIVVTNNNNGGLPVAKHTNLRTGLYSKVVTGMRCGINLRLMRYSDVLLRAAECENEVNGPTQQAIDWINQVRERAGLAKLKLDDFSSDDKLFEQIANVERPKEFGCEFGRGFDLIRWGWFYNSGRLQQLKEHAAVNFWTKADYQSGEKNFTPKDPVFYGIDAEGKKTYSKSSFDTWINGHEFIPIYQGTLNDNPKLQGNSANNSTSNESSLYGPVHPVVNL